MQVLPAAKEEEEEAAQEPPPYDDQPAERGAAHLGARPAGARAEHDAVSECVLIA